MAMVIDRMLILIKYRYGISSSIGIDVQNESLMLG